jgi:SpoVK/Ycf46/Vps4 family AAA+-type ATPase
MLRSHLSDGATTAAKAWSHAEVEPRHIAYAIARFFRDRPEAAAFLPRAKAALEPRGTALTAPVLSDEAKALLDSISSPEAAIDALRALLGEGERQEETGSEQGSGKGVSEDPAGSATPGGGGVASSETVEEVLAELDGLVGLDAVKEQVRSVMAVVRANQERAEAGLEIVNPGLHLVFTGSPGTGKTTVARLIARLYAAVGALPGSNFIEVDRSALVAGYVGQTAMKTAEVIEKTLPGVLFVDEAYSLTPSHGSDFGAEATATLVKAMEDHRHELAVIVAGYREEMAEFVDSNPGLRSRLKTFVDFPDYAPDELVQIFGGFAESTGLHLSTDALDKAEGLFRQAVNRADFGNARFARSLFEQAYARMAVRAAADEDVHVDELTELIPDDLQWQELGPEAKTRRIGFVDSGPGSEEGANEAP